MQNRGIEAARRLALSFSHLTAFWRSSWQSVVQYFARPLLVGNILPHHWHGMRRSCDSSGFFFGAGSGFRTTTK